MRAQCCICADLFENSSNVRIAAVPCGHTFHEECLMRWLETSSTCPSCRKQVKKNQIIKRLYFDISEEEVDLSDPDKLINEINSLKAQVCDHAAGKRELVTSRDALSETLAQCLASKEDTQRQLKQEQQDKLLIKRQLASAEKENNLYKRQAAEYMATQKKLKKLENIQLMLEGSENDVSDMVGCYSDGSEATVKQLSSMVVVVKREYNKALDDKKALRDHIKKVKTDNVQTQIKMDKMKQEVKKIQQALKKSNQDVFSLERENNLNRRKIAHLRSVIKHNKTDGSQSFIAAINEDSPNVAYTPPPPSHSVSGDTKTEEEVVSNDQREENNCSPDLFEESIIEEPTQEDDNENNESQIHVAPKFLKMVHISSAAEKFQAAKQAKIESDKQAAPSLPYSNFSILQKKLTGLSNSRPVALPTMRAFNGMGGSVKVDLPTDTPVGGHARFRPLKRKFPKKRHPLATKLSPSQQMLTACLAKTSTATVSSSSLASDGPPSISLFKKKTLSSSVVNRNQSYVNNLFGKTKTVKPSSSIASSSSSSSSSIMLSSGLSHLSRPSSGFIDLT